MKRKSISNKIRFEVFKRDQFTCQYCGKKAPDVLLEIDHIKPVAKSGTNNILNLITSCKECNSGKSKNELNDNSVIEKQRKQLEDLEERRQQLNMLLAWHDGLLEHDAVELEKFIEYFNKVNESSIELTDKGKRILKFNIKKYGFKKVLESVDLINTKHPNLTAEEKLKKIGSFLNYDSASDDEKKVMYIRGICRNRFSFFDYDYGTQLIRSTVAQYKYDFLVEKAKTCKHWTEWKELMEYLIIPDSDPDEDLPF